MVARGEQCTRHELLSVKRGFILFLEGRDSPALDGGMLLFSNKSFGELDPLSSGQSRPAKYVSSIKDSNRLLTKIMK